ncbi:hypothetical protein [Nostoc sp. 106C]|uniref:DUF6887 family protein n=1 Tax=Nostoc sp. 106C TaxID=1932667 RepID=UPI001412045B|nr:hypothetical protein [Nostoc sp. 106C]
MSDYLSLSEVELRKYVIAHPDDEDAFQHYLEIVRAKPGRIVVKTTEQLIEEIKKRMAS